MSGWRNFCCIPVAGNEREEFGRDRKGISEITIIYYGKITQYLIQSTVQGSEVRAWEEDIMLPTYEIGKEEKNPIFLEKRVYQGSCGSVYPYPVVEKISDKKADKRYHALFIENEYIKVMILPELGGRIHMAYDKVKNVILFITTKL